MKIQASALAVFLLAAQQQATAFVNNPARKSMAAQPILSSYLEEIDNVQKKTNGASQKFATEPSTFIAPPPTHKSPEVKDVSNANPFYAGIPHQQEAQRNGASSPAKASSTEDGPIDLGMELEKLSKSELESELERLSKKLAEIRFEKAQQDLNMLREQVQDGPEPQQQQRETRSRFDDPPKSRDAPHFDPPPPPRAQHTQPPPPPQTVQDNINYPPHPGNIPPRPENGFYHPQEVTPDHGAFHEPMPASGQRQQQQQQVRTQSATQFSIPREESFQDGQVAPTSAMTWPGLAQPEVDPDLFDGVKLMDLWDEERETVVQGGSLRTWTFNSPAVERVQIMMKTEGRPLNTDIDLWHGPDNTPERLSVYVEDGSVRPFCAVIETPRGSNVVAVRNSGHLEFPMSAIVNVGESVGNAYEPLPEVPSDRGVSNKIIQGGAIHTTPFSYDVGAVRVMLKTDGRPLKARVELLQGPNNNKQVIEIYTEDGMERPFYGIIETPGTGNVVRIVNTATVEFPLTASIEPFRYEEEDYSLLGVSDQDRPGADGGNSFPY